MSKSDFHDRLQRIGTTAPQQQPMTGTAPRAGRSTKRKPRYGLLVVGPLLAVLGGQVLKYTNNNYEAIRDSNGIDAVAGLGLGAVVAVLIGCIVTLRAVFGRTAAAHDMATPKRQASAFARRFYAFLGFVFGAVTCLSWLLGYVARRLETVEAQTFANGTIVIMALLALVSLLFGLVSIFLRGYALGRVPVYFLCGAVLTYAALRFFRINPLDWPQFVEFLQ